MNSIPIIHHEAKRLLAHGLSIVPMKTDGSKRTAIAWKELQQRRLSPAEADNLFLSQPYGIGVICGCVSGGLECLDFDNGSLFEPWSRQIPAALLAKLVIVQTPRSNHGYHVYYRCSVVSPNHKIAYSDSGIAIESRGEGGLAIVPGSASGTHPNGDYEYLTERDLAEVQVISPEERKLLWQAARTFDNGRAIEEFKAKAWQAFEKSLKPAYQPTLGDLTPWDDFEGKASWQEILSPHGWTTTDGIYWRRPGKEHGHSATIGRSRDGRSEVLVVFTKGDPKLEEGSYGKYRTWSQLNFGGNHKLAVSELRRLGFGSNSTSNVAEVDFQFSFGKKKA